MSDQRVIIPCQDMLHSEHNGDDYCRHPAAHGSTPYCRPDPRCSAFTCPRGYPAHRWEVKEHVDLEDDGEDIAEEIRAGRQATLEGF